MILTLHQPGVWGVPLYGIFYFLGSALSLTLAFCVVRSSSAYRQVHYFDLMALTWLAGVLGAKALSLSMRPESISAMIRAWGWMNIFEGGYALFGGIVLSIVVFTLGMWVWRLPVWKCVSLLLLSALPGLALGRLGCLFAGCCFGKSANHFPLLIQYDSGVYPFMLAQAVRLPVQLINASVSLLLGGWIWIMVVRWSWRVDTFKRAGLILSIVLMIFGGERFLEEFYRDPLSRVDRWFWNGWGFNQWAALFLMGGGVIVGALWMWIYALRSQTVVKS